MPSIITDLCKIIKKEIDTQGKKRAPPSGSASSLSYSLAIDHEVQKLVDVLFLVRDDLQLRNLTIGENISQRHILTKLGLQIQSVSFTGN